MESSNTIEENLRTYLAKEVKLYEEQDGQEGEFVRFSDVAQENDGNLKELDKALNSIKDGLLNMRNFKAQIDREKLQLQTHFSTFNAYKRGEYKKKGFKLKSKMEQSDNVELNIGGEPMDCKVEVLCKVEGSQL